MQAIRPSLVAGLKLMRDSNPRLFWIMGFISTLEALITPLIALATGMFITAVEPAVNTGSVNSPEGRHLVWMFLFLVGLFAISQTVEPLINAHREGFRAVINAHRRERVMRATLAVPGIRHLEDPKYLDALRLASSRDWPDPGSFAVGVYELYKQRIAAWTSGILIGLTFNWIIGLLLPIAWGIVGYYMRQGQGEGFSDTRTELRRNQYFRDIAYDNVAAKETRIFELKNWTLENYSGTWLSVMKQVWKKRQGVLFQRIALLVSAFAVNGLAFGWLGWAAFHGEIGFGQIATVGFAILATANLAQMNEHTMSVSLGTACFPALIEVEEVANSDIDLRMTGDKPADGLPKNEIVFENVSFTYPGRDEPVYKNLNLRLVAGQSLGIVGNNGAGKTTLIKLLARLYDPDEGRILVDGVDLRDLDPRAWQRRVAAIFQDFVHYEYSAHDNVTFGGLEHSTDNEMRQRAAELVGADELISRLPDGWDTLLSRRFEGGVDLSGGQWQRIALARALFAVESGAGVLVLDEPTANLDAKAEVLLFDRFLDVTKGSTSVLISHRFSTVRRADRIVVIEHGQVIEDGNHDELLALDGAYARAFNLQAGRYAHDDNDGEQLEETLEVEQ